MLSRSVRRRLARWRTLPPEPTGSAVRVSLQLRQTNNITTSFLILPGEETSAVLSGFVDKAGGFERVQVPVNIRATIV